MTEKEKTPEKMEVQAKRLAEKWRKKRAALLGCSTIRARKDSWELDMKKYTDLAVPEFLNIVRVPIESWRLELDERKDGTNDYSWCQKTIYSSIFQGIELRLIRKESGIESGYYHGCEYQGFSPRVIPGNYSFELRLEAGEPLNETFSERYRGIRELFREIDK